MKPEQDFLDMRDMIDRLSPAYARYTLGRVKTEAMNPFLLERLKAKAAEPEQPPTLPPPGAGWDRYDYGPGQYEKDWELWKAGAIDAADLASKWSGRTPARPEEAPKIEEPPPPEDVNACYEE